MSEGHSYKTEYSLGYHVIFRPDYLFAKNLGTDLGIETLILELVLDLEELAFTQSRYSYQQVLMLFSIFTDQSRHALSILLIAFNWFF